MPFKSLAPASCVTRSARVITLDSDADGDVLRVVAITMVYTHVLNWGLLGVRSPLV